MDNHDWINSRTENTAAMSDCKRHIALSVLYYLKWNGPSPRLRPLSV